MKIGIWELVVIFVIALFVIGPDRFPEFTRKLGKGLKELKNATNDLSREFKENVTEPLSEAAKPVQEAMEPFQEVAKEFNNIDKTLKNASKPGGLKKMAAQSIEKELTGAAEKDNKASTGNDPESEDLKNEAPAEKTSESDDIENETVTDNTPESDDIENEALKSKAPDGGNMGNTEEE